MSLSITTPHTNIRTGRSEQLLKRYGVADIFLYRYAKGMRTIGLLLVGLTDISWVRFTILNAASIFVWALLLVGASYVFGEAISGHFCIVLLLVSIALIWLGVHKMSRHASTERDL